MKVFKIIVCIVIVLVITILCFMFHQLSNIQIRQTKDYAIMVVEEDDIIDCDMTLSPPDKYSQLLQISDEMRKEVSEYMKKTT